MSWFDSEEIKIRKSHLLNLIILALSDGKLDTSELDLLITIAARWGVTPNEFNDILKNPHKVKLTRPENKSERAIQLIDLVYMVMVDGKIHEGEMDICKSLAVYLGYPPSIVDKLIQLILDSINQKLERDTILKKIIELN